MRKHVEDTSDQWQNWFAWHPIWVNLGGKKGVWIWWETVQRKDTPCYDGVMIHIRNKDGSDL